MGQTIFQRLHLLLQSVFANFTQVDISISSSKYNSAGDFASFTEK